jgi:hypothetical protein
MYNGVVVNWLAIGSTATVNAIDHIRQTQTPVYLVDDTKVSPSHGAKLRPRANRLVTNGGGTGVGPGHRNDPPTPGSTAAGASAATQRDRVSHRRVPRPARMGTLPATGTPRLDPKDQGGASRKGLPWPRGESVPMPPAVERSVVRHRLAASCLETGIVASCFPILANVLLQDLDPRHGLGRGRR